MNAISKIDAYQAILDHSFVITLTSGMKLRFDKPLTFGALAKMVMPKDEQIATGIFNGVFCTADYLIASGGHVQFGVEMHDLIANQR